MKNRLPHAHWHSKNVIFSIVLALFGLLRASTVAWATDTDLANAPKDISVSVNPASPVCAGTNVSLSASGCPTNGTIRWSTQQTGASITVTPARTTTYTAFCDVTTVTSTTSTVTSTSATGTVQVISPIVVTQALVNVSCNNGSDGQVNINASGGGGTLQYQFNGQAYGDRTLFGNLKAGTYTISVKDATCTATSSVTITQPAALTAAVTIVPAKCIGGADGAIIAVASGGVGNYRYILNNGTPQESGTFISLKANTAYSLIVSDKNNCISSSIPVTVGAPAAFTINPTTTLTRCVGSSDGTIAVAVTGGNGPYQYQINNGPFQGGPLFTGLAAATYQIGVKDANGCLASQNAVVDQVTPLKLTAVAKPVNCYGPSSGTITVTPSGGTGAITYQLASVKVPQISNVFTGLITGEYTILATDANGCSGITSVTVAQAAPLKIQAAATAATCCVCPTGTVKLISTGGSGINRLFQTIGQPYSDITQINGLRPNTYGFRVIDEAGCTDSVRVVIANASALTLTTGTIKDVSCTGGRDGEAAVVLTGGLKPFTFYWTTERRDTLRNRTATQTNLVEGTYTVTVLDSGRCSTNSVFVSVKAKNPVPFKPVVTQAGSGTLTVDQASGIQWYVRSGIDTAKAVSNATSQTLVPFASGQYYVVVTLNGCSSPQSDPINFILTAISEPVAGLSVRVVPNPVVDRLRLEIEQVERSAVQIQLLDASGRAVREYQLPAFTGKKQAEWPMTDMPTGTYLLKVAAESRQSVLRVLVE